MSEIQTFYANGKLLLTGEYFVLQGAEALALPTKLGQALTVETSSSPYSTWQSFDADKNMWFICEFDSTSFLIEKTTDEAIANRLMSILKTAQALSLKALTSANFTTNLTFPRNWGLGTSSTLIFSLAKYYNINPFVLLEQTFGGSGYDIACAGAKKSIIYTKNEGIPSWRDVDFKPVFYENIYFIYLNKKQDSREGIKRFKEKIKTLPPQLTADISALTEAFLTCKTLTDFDKLIVEHERITASIIELPRAKQLYFNDFDGEIKSLGAWGGDFVMATSVRNFEDVNDYFSSKGFTTVLEYKDLIL
jgi:mevalonate kinase